jgi:hypothetical protein
MLEEFRKLVPGEEEWFFEGELGDLKDLTAVVNRSLTSECWHLARAIMDAPTRVLPDECTVQRVRWQQPSS